jgi:hypothetical protein
VQGTAGSVVTLDFWDKIQKLFARNSMAYKSPTLEKAALRQNLRSISTGGHRTATVLEGHVGRLGTWLHKPSKTGAAVQKE